MSPTRTCAVALTGFVTVATTTVALGSWSPALADWQEGGRTSGGSSTSSSPAATARDRREPVPVLHLRKHPLTLWDPCTDADSQLPHAVDAVEAWLFGCG